jgi:malonyl-CoA O-methyltransferase
MTDSLVSLDRQAVARAFARAAAGYDAAAVLQREIGTRLVERLTLMRLEPKTVLDLGCGTGRLTYILMKRYPQVQVVGVDLAPAMLQAARHRTPWAWPWQRRTQWLAADAERLPLADASCDLIVSNLMLQWCNPDTVFAECRRLLRPGGLLLFTTFGPDTLKELRAAWQAADGGVHVHDFIDMHDLGDALLRARFADPVMDVERLTLTYTDVQSLMRDLKAIGAHNAASVRPRVLTGKARFARFKTAYEQFRDRDGRLPASYEIVYGHAWAPVMSKAGEAHVPLTSLKRRSS